MVSLTEEVALQRHERLTELKMRLLGDRVSRRVAWKIAREQGWETIYDAEYLAITRLQADALVTVDPALAAKAKRACAARAAGGPRAETGVKPTCHSCPDAR